jgi:imidazolonepropionase-like amidohydrolase
VNSVIRLTALGAVLVAVLVPLVPASAQEDVVIQAGRLVDVERGEVRQNQLIVVRQGRIASVAPAGSGLPSGVPVIDLSRYTVLPGLIDCHSHLIGDASSADVLHPLERSEAQEAFSGIRNARATLLAGFTAVRDIGTYRAFVDASLRDAIVDGTVAGPRMRVAGAYVTVSTGGGELVGAAPDVTLPRLFASAWPIPAIRYASGCARS